MEGSTGNFEIMVRYDEDIFEGSVRERPANAEAVITMRQGDTYIIGREGESWGMLEFLVPHFTELLRRLPAIERGERVEVTYIDTPGSIAFVPRSDETVGVWVGDGNEADGAEIPDDGLPVPTEAVIREIVETGREVLDRIKAIAPDATADDEVREFQELLEAAEQTYQ